MRLVSGHEATVRGRKKLAHCPAKKNQQHSAGPRGRAPLFANSLRWCPVFSSQPTRPLFLAGCHPIIIETPNQPSQSPSATTRPATSEKKPSAVRS